MEEGIRLVAANRPDALTFARAVAIVIAQASPDRCCDADQVQKYLLREGMQLGNAAGAVFRGNQWVFTGKFKNSERTTNHQRVIRVWRLVG